MPTLPLDGPWQFRLAGNPLGEMAYAASLTDWMPATVPGTVHHHLHLLEKIPEPHYSRNELEMQWINSNSVHAGGNLLMHLRVTDGGTAADGARLTFRLARPDSAPYYAQVLTDASGNAEMTFQVDETSLADSSVLVQASFSGRTATRKFRLRST